MTRRRKILLVLLGVLLLLPSATVYWVVTTEAGLNFLVKRLQKVGPVTITAGETTGTLVRGITISTLRVQHRLADIHVEEVTGRVSLMPLLLRREIEVPEFTARRIAITLIDDPVERPPRPPRFLPALLRVDAEDLSVDTLDLTLKNGRELQFIGIHGRGSVLPQQIRARDITVDWEDWHLTGNARLHARRPYGLDGEIDALWRPANQPGWRMAGRFDGDLDDLPFTGAVSEPFNATLAGKAVLNSNWQVGGHAVVSDFDLVDFGGSAALGLISGELDVSTNRDGITASGVLTPPGLKAGEFNVDFRGRYQQKRLDILDTVIIHPVARTRATVRGAVTIEPGGPRLALNGEWTALRWPLVGAEPAFTSPFGHYVMQGVKPWQVEAEGEVIAAGQPAMPARARGQLGGQSFLIEEGTVEALGGRARFTGEARWQPAESWQVQGHMTGLDTARLREDLPGELGFDFRAGGAPFGEAGSLELDITDLGGELRERKAAGKGHFFRAGGSTDWQFDGVDFTLGTTHLKLDGGLGARSDLRFSVDASDLSLFDPEARGKLVASGRYAGTRDAPLLKFSAQGEDFEWGDYRLAALEADVDVDFSGEPGRAQGVVELTTLKLGERTIDAASLKLTGSGQAQRLAFTLDATPLKTALTAEGGLRDGLWQGEITGFTIDNADRLALRNETVAPLAFNLQQAELGQLCMMGEAERLCASARRAADGTWSAAFSADALPLTSFTAGLSQEYSFDGTIDVRGELAGKPGDLPTGSIEGQLMEARLRHRVGADREEVMSLGTGTVKASAGTDAFAVQVELDAKAAGSIRGHLEGQRSRAEWRDYPIRGSLDAQTDGLSLLDVFIGEIDRATGRLITRVEVNGTLGMPTVQGLLQLRDASIDIFQTGTSLRELSLDANFDANALQLSGRSRLGQGTGEQGMAQFEGRLTWRDREPYGDLSVKGESLLVVNVPEARIQASPDLDFKIEGRHIDARGTVRIPHALIEPADLTTAVLPSSDERLIGAPVVDPSQRWTVSSNIRLELGNDVHLESLGLTAQLGGALQLRSDGTQLTRGEGELNITEGKYAGFGRQLDIERGALIFNNVPLGDPGIDLRAQKELPEATVGVIVRGTLRRPAAPIFYSEPAMPQSQIASLILAGGSITALGENQTSGAARNDLLAQGTAILAQRLGGQVGLDDVGIESDTSNQASLVLGKYLSDRLYLSYGISLAEAINTLKLRWTITDRWTIRTEAGQERSADVVFTLKR
ncbi:MAG TPA: translocation/assembly module TamB domain-containing protein [Steroidobacteraceae bacterium]|nr:translocation/assembly module TamB domain-containing protein [Steroidobacteraceae bacterium]